MTNNRRRPIEAYEVRENAARIARERVQPEHVANGDETKFRRTVEGKDKPSLLASFTKGLNHCRQTGLVENPDDFVAFVRGIDSGDPRDFIDTPLGPTAGWCSPKAIKANAKVRAWESQGAGLTFALQGPDSQAVTMPPAPALGSDELTAEMGEVYVQALLRDVPFTQIAAGRGDVKLRGRTKTTVKELLGLLNDLNWFKESECCGLTDAEANRKRKPFNGQTAFRGITPGDDIGPYISQFMLAGTGGINGGSDNDERKPSEGLITYGAITIDQRVRQAKPHDDHMTTWSEWLDVQNGANLGAMEQYVPGSRRFITTPRDLATYVHYDALYEAYLNACLMMLWYGIPLDPGIPFQADDSVDHQQGFAHFGGPHILSLVTEVATRALKAVRFQKFNVHRRLRPEALAGRISNYCEVGAAEIESMVDALQPILQLVDSRNPTDPELPNGNFLLPMAFCEGSPMHPAYGAGHATVAGACVTILKAFFDHKHPLAIATKGLAGTGDASQAFVPNATGDALDLINVVDDCGNRASLTVEGELNKLASNISIGRDWAGVHYFTDYIESLRMGERIAIGILEEQKLTYGENFSMTVPLYDGGSVRI